MHATPAHAAPMQPPTHTQPPCVHTSVPGSTSPTPVPHTCTPRAAHTARPTQATSCRLRPHSDVPIPMGGRGPRPPLRCAAAAAPVPGGPQGRALRVGRLPSPAAGCQIPPPTQEAVGALSALCTGARPARGMRASEEGLEERNQVSPEPPASPWHAAAGSFEEAGRGSGPGDVPSGAHGMRLAGARSLEEPPRPRCGVSPK